jgi:hypothetical protein
LMVLTAVAVAFGQLRSAPAPGYAACRRAHTTPIATTLKSAIAAPQSSSTRSSRVLRYNMSFWAV